jgi:hypothetical protein
MATAAFAPFPAIRENNREKYRFLRSLRQTVILNSITTLLTPTPFISASSRFTRSYNASAEDASIFQRPDSAERGIILAHFAFRFRPET